MIQLLQHLGKALIVIIATCSFICIFAFSDDAPILSQVIWTSTSVIVFTLSAIALDKLGMLGSDDDELNII